MDYNLVILAKNLTYIFLNSISNRMYVNLSTFLSFLIFRWSRRQRFQEGIEISEVLQWKWSKAEKAKSQPFHPASTPISGQDIFPPTISDTRRAHAIGERPGNDWTSDQKLVSKQAISEKTSRQWRKKTGWTGYISSDMKRQRKT